MSDYGNQNKKNNNNDGGGWFIWALIVFLFSTGAWFFALPLLFFKLFAPDKTKQSRQAPPLYKTQQASSPYRAEDERGYQQNKRREETARARAERERQSREREERRREESRAKKAVEEATRSPGTNAKTGNILLIFGIIVAFIGGALLIDPIDMAVWLGSVSGYVGDILQGLAFLAGGVGMFLSGLGIKRAVKRYARYLAVVGKTEAVSVESLSRKLGYSKKRVIKDLNNMIEKGYFGPTAYLNMELGYLFLTSEADREVSELRRAAEEKTVEARAAEAQDGYQVFLKNIRAANDAIADPVLSEKISRLESVTEQIFKTVEADPSKIGKIDTFLSYYLPTTQKLLDSYAKMERTGVDGENVRQTKASIESTMDTVIRGFEYQLDELYKTDALDIESDITVIKRMMDRDISSASRDFKVREQAPAPAEEKAEEAAPKDVDLGGSAGQTK